MKLRRALTTVAATAVIAPAALMAAPAAHATGPDAEPSASASPTPSAPGPEQSSTPTPPAETPAGGGEGTPGGETPPGGEGSATPSASATPGGTITPSPTAGPTAPATPTAPGTPSTTPSDEPECTIDDASLDVTVANLPSKLVAGGDWSRFTIKLANTTDKKLDEVYPFVLAVPLEDGADRPGTSLHLEYQDPNTGKWTAFGAWSDGDYFGWFELEAHRTAALGMRIRADRSAPPGDGFALVAGDYYNEDGSCGSSQEQWYDFAVLSAGSRPGEVPPAGPGKPGNKPGPQGGVRPVATGRPGKDLDRLPVTGNLAATGSSSALPTIGLVGGVATAVGAGAVFAVRRRRAAGGTAA
ncbi:cell wall protein [Streptomyces noursei]|uniref:Cell wall protein n=1 Tax=Streptomyces noursei TaxID=1971 RepID=A0A2N8PED4_STRNR|nr:cell wall protein [Streptomyces noursei]PNE39379.1 cell wall protein [Streptomyces noursei]